MSSAFTVDNILANCVPGCGGKVRGAFHDDIWACENNGCVCGAIDEALPVDTDTSRQRGEKQRSRGWECVEDVEQNTEKQQQQQQQIWRRQRS